jgi:hypothetical protein
MKNLKGRANRQDKTTLDQRMKESYERGLANHSTLNPTLSDGNVAPMA